MDLRRRLEMVQGPGARPPQPETAEVAVSKAQGGALERILGGESTLGFHRRQQQLGWELAHGPFPMREAVEFPLQWLTRWSPELRDFDPREALYLDTETTGLAGGSGTYAFLIGLAWFDSASCKLVIEQLTMREHSEEKAMLGYLRERVARASGLVTFNGKSFDVPLLATRFAMNRLTSDLEGLPHLDLLHVSRRLWVQALPDCRLETLESELLGLPRQGDIPGWLVPQLYFRFLQTGDPRGIAQIAEHNRRDMLTMVGLISGLKGYLEDPVCPSKRFRAELRACEDLNLGRWFFRLRQFDVAVELCERALVHVHDPRQRRQACLLLARMRSRLHGPQAAFELWERMLGWDSEDYTALEEMAKHYEHRLQDPAHALGLVERALKCQLLTPGRRRRLFGRRDRLQQRIAKAR